MKPTIKAIEVTCRAWPDGRWEPFVAFDRWTGNSTETTPDFSTRSFYHPTQASIARCRRAQDKAAGAAVEIFRAPVEFTGVIRSAVAEEYLSERADDPVPLAAKEG